MLRELDLENWVTQFALEFARPILALSGSYYVLDLFLSNVNATRMLPCLMELWWLQGVFIVIIIIIILWGGKSVIT